MALLTMRVMNESAALAPEKEAWDPTPTNLRSGLMFIQYCTSWSYRGTFNQVANLVHNNCISDVDVQGGEYPPLPEKVFIASIVWYIQMFLFAIIFGGQAISNHLGIELPEGAKKMLENKFALFMFVWLFGNSIQSSLMSTGAFEIYHGHDKIWSSIEANRLPNHRDLMRAFEKQGIECIQPRAVPRG